MKKLFTYLLVAITMIIAGCSEPFDDSAIWDELNNLENRIAKLEELCKQVNTNISSLQTIVNALQNNDYVTGVTPITKDGETIGYTISFTKSQPITIYHGEDGKDGQDGANGKDGADGKDGSTPVIGVKQDYDDIYYWTLNGEWLLDTDGNKIKAQGTDGKDGADGKDGEDGVNGADGITPQLKIENGYWYISYDNGTSWTQLGKATGEDGKDGINGNNGADGKDGDSFFQSITWDEACVYFTLADGTVISVPISVNTNEYDDDPNKIYYTTIDGNKISPLSGGEDLFGANLIYNAYNDGRGVLVFDDTITSVGGFAELSSLATITIPESVTSIKDDAFRHCSNLVNISIPNSITSIGRYAFTGCSSLASIIIPKGVSEIGDGAFYYCNGIASIIIPDGVTSIGNYTFYGCLGLSRVIIGDNVSAIGESVFYGCSSLTSVTIGKGVTSIGNSAFTNCSSLTSITIPESVISIGNSAFSYCENLTSVTIPDLVTSIGENAFSDCSILACVTIGNGVKSIGNSAFRKCSSLASITIPESVTSIGSNAFMYCKSLTSVTIPNRVTSIEKELFYDCSNLTSVIIGSSVRLIGNSAFKNCSSLTDITIPDGVEDIGTSAFSGCSNLASILIPNSVTSIAGGAFSGCTGELTVKCDIPDPSSSYGSGIFHGSKFTKVTLSNDVTSIGEKAFYNCNSIESLTIGSGITSIGRDAFSGCTGELTINGNIPDASSSFLGSFYDSNFTKVTIGHSVTSIGKYAFYNNGNLSEVCISDVAAWCRIGFGNLYANPLYYAHNLYLNGELVTDLVIPNEVDFIEQNTFAYCTSIESITLHEGITEVGDSAFYNCSRLAEVYCKPTTPPIGSDYMLSYNASSRKIYVPTISVEAYKTADGWKNYASDIVGYDFSV